MSILSDLDRFESLPTYGFPISVASALLLRIPGPAAVEAVLATVSATILSVYGLGLVLNWHDFATRTRFAPGTFFGRVMGAVLVIISVMFWALVVVRVTQI
jgi:hypothetical protein